MIAFLLHAHGVKNVVASPGSRNAPLLLACDRQEGLQVRSIVDERAAAFVALGIAEASNNPVALVCTSGTALLNYAPAVAEAFYRRLPLIVVSADRPAQWIDQDDSQTINQPGALEKIVKDTVDIPAEADILPDGPWLTNRLINHALLQATASPPGPVHINIRLDLLPRPKPQSPFCTRVITQQQPNSLLSKTEIGQWAERLRDRKLMVVAGFMQPQHKMSKALGRLADLPNVAVLTETVANLFSPALLSNIDALMPPLTCVTEAMVPDVVITVGGAIVSRRLKEWIRSLPAVEHWSVGPQLTTVDPFRKLTCRIELQAAQFIGQLATALAPVAMQSDFSLLWHTAAIQAKKRLHGIISSAPWCDLTAINAIVKALPRETDLVSGNGTVIRYLQLLDCSHLHRVDCNRGVSGIDGQTSTAIGHALAKPERPVWLITGDTAGAYDAGILLHCQLPSNFRMVVIDNGGGAIFRFVKATAAYPADVLENRLICNPTVNWTGLADAAGMACFTADSHQTLVIALEMMASATRASMLVIKTNPTISTDILNQLLNP